MKLTKPQMSLLKEVAKGNAHCVHYYRPAQALVSMGYCVWGTLSRLEITDAGRAAIEKEGRE